MARFATRGIKDRQFSWRSSVSGHAGQSRAGVRGKNDKPVLAPAATPRDWRVAVPVRPGRRFLPGKSSTILPANASYLGDGPSMSDRHYDLSLDGKRFLMVKRVQGTGARSMVVMQNWTEELKRLVPRN
jgi:hypothetical protein